MCFPYVAVGPMGLPAGTLAALGRRGAPGGTYLPACPCAHPVALTLWDVFHTLVHGAGEGRVPRRYRPRSGIASSSPRSFRSRGSRSAMADRAGYPCRAVEAAPGTRSPCAGTGEASIRRVIPVAQAVANTGVRAAGLIGGE